MEEFIIEKSSDEGEFSVKKNVETNLDITCAYQPIFQRGAAWIKKYFIAIYSFFIACLSKVLAFSMRHLHTSHSDFISGGGDSCVF